MLTTTRDWKVALGCYKVPNRDRLNPPNDIKIEYEQIDATAQNSANVSTNSYALFSDTSEITDLSLDYSSYNTIATLEPNEWVLDDTAEFYGQGLIYRHAGWVSGSYSKADGTFDENPYVRLWWASQTTTTIGGITLAFSSRLNEWATEFTITAKANGSVVFQKDYTATSAQGYYEGAMVGYDELIVEIKKWCMPYRHARIETVCLGLTVSIGKSEVLSAEQSMSSDLLSFTLPDDSFTFEVDNVSEEWNPDNPSGIYTYLTERQRVNVKYAFKINGAYEWHTVGTYFMSEWTTPQNGISASFTARSLIDFMGKKFVPENIYIGSIIIIEYNYGDEISLKNLAINAFRQAGLPINADGSVKWQIADELDDINVVIPYSTNEVDGVTTYSYDFDFTCAEVIQLCANAGCAVIRPNENGDICIKMPSQIVSDYYVDQFVAYSNGEYDMAKALKTININNGELVYTPTGTVSTGEEQSISNCLLQSASQRTAECAWVSDLLLKRKSIDGEFRADPRLQPLDVITNVNKYAGNRVYVEEVKWTYAGAFKGTYKGKVIKSIPIADTEGWWYSNDIYAGGQWG